MSDIFAALLVMVAGLFVCLYPWDPARPYKVTTAVLWGLVGCCFVYFIACRFS